MLTLDKLPPGQTGTITAVNGQGALRRRLLDMGLTPGTPVTFCKAAPMGDPIEVELRGYSLTLRREDAAGIEIDGEMTHRSAASHTGAHLPGGPAQPAKTAAPKEEEADG